MSRLPLQDIIEKYNQLNEKLANTSDTEKLIELSKQQNKIGVQYELAKKILDAEKSISENEELLKELESGDTEMLELAKMDIEEQKEIFSKSEDELLTYLSPEDPRDDSDILLEIRAGAGGDESSLFAVEMLKTYSIMAEKLGLKVQIIDTSINGIGGYKEVVAEVRGNGAYSWFKYESGVHRVQRVPATEKQGRIHTSTISVAIMPLIKDNDDFKLDPKEVEIILSTSSGKGGQSVNTTYSAVKMVHTPTGIEAQSQDERNQLQNKIKCMAVLTSRVYDHFEQIRQDEERKLRQDQVGNNDRSEKIRTYNFPQDRLTDHRYSQNWNQLPVIMSGGIKEVIEDIRKLEAERNIANLNKK